MIDARGFSCPTPVVMVQQEVKKSAPRTLEVLVDNRCSVENVTRFGKGQGYQVAVAAEGHDFRLTLSK
jgi:TusA-related sulfurtransferase